MAGEESEGIVQDWAEQQEKGTVPRGPVVVAVLSDPGGLIPWWLGWLGGDLHLCQSFGSREAPGEPGEGLSREGFSLLPWPL